MALASYPSIAPLIRWRHMALYKSVLIDPKTLDVVSQSLDVASQLHNYSCKQ